MNIAMAFDTAPLLPAPHHPSPVLTLQLVVIVAPTLFLMVNGVTSILTALSPVL